MSARAQGPETFERHEYGDVATPDPRFVRRRVVAGLGAVAAAVALVGLLGLPVLIVAIAVVALPACLSTLWVIKRFHVTSLGSDKSPSPARDGSAS